MLFAHPYIEHWNTYPTFQLHTNKHHHFQQQPSHFISQSQVSGKYCSCFHSDELLYVAKQSKHRSGHGSHIQPAGWVTTAVAGVMTLHCTVRRRDKCHRDSVSMSRALTSAPPGTTDNVRVTATTASSHRLLCFHRAGSHALMGAGESESVTPRDNIMILLRHAPSRALQRHNALYYEDRIRRKSAGNF